MYHVLLSIDHVGERVGTDYHVLVANQLSMSVETL